MSSEEGTGGNEAREHLANERTLLARVRTGVSLISFGLVESIGAQLCSGRVFGITPAILGRLALVMGTLQFRNFGVPLPKLSPR